MTVIDSSVLVELLLGGSPRAAAVASRLQRPGESLHAPHLIDLEVLSVLRRLEPRHIDPRQLSRVAADLDAVPLRRYPHHLLVTRIWELQRNMTAYDASYVALAERLEVPLVTCDARLARAPGHAAMIEHIG